jgi:sec-independent protein translocase protein TatB
LGKISDYLTIKGLYMFGMGFIEIFLVLIVAIIALGPEKLPGAMVETVKFFKKIKGELGEAKSTIDKELDLSQMKEDAAQLKESVSNIQQMANIDIDEITNTNSKPTMEQLTEEKKVKEPSVEDAESKKAQKQSSKKEKISMDKGNKV